MFAARRLTSTVAPLSSSIRSFNNINLTSTRNFHSSIINMVKVGDKIPDVTLVEAKPDGKVSIAQELASGKGVRITRQRWFQDFIHIY